MRYFVFAVLLLYVHLQGHRTDIIPWTLQTDTSCYGNTGGDFLEPVCIDSKLVVWKVYALAKELKTSCPETATPADKDEEKCCTFAEEDCKMQYNTSNTSPYVFQVKCTGQATCKVQTPWMETTCNKSVFLHRSNYMLLEYYCVPDSLILNASSTENGVKEGRAVYLQNDDNPEPSSIGGLCSVSSSCRTSISISVILQNVTGDCDHVIQVTDGGQDQTINCSSNNFDDYGITEVYKSDSHFLILNFNGVSANNTGSFWIQLKGSNRNSSIALRCGSSAVSDPPEVGACPIFQDDDTTTSKTSSSLTTSHLNPEPPSEESTASTKGEKTGIIVGVVVAVLVILVVVIAVVLYKKMSSKNSKVSDKQPIIDEKVDGGDKKSIFVHGNSLQNKDLVFNDDGLPVYTYAGSGGGSGIMKQQLPMVTRLITSSETSPKPVDEDSKPVRVKTALRRFDQVTKEAKQGNKPLPELRGVDHVRPKAESSVVPVPVVPSTDSFPVDPRGSLFENEALGQANGELTVEQPRDESAKRKKKKKKKSLEEDEENPNRKKKKKKKREKQDE